MVLLGGIATTIQYADGVFGGIATTTKYVEMTKLVCVLPASVEVPCLYSLMLLFYIYVYFIFYPCISCFL